MLRISILASNLYTLLLSRGVESVPLDLLSTNTSSTSVKWSSCVSQRFQGLECAQVKVPLDYSKPNGATTTLGLARLKTNSSSCLGNLFVNPGGPGGPGTDLLMDGQRLFNDEIFTHYNIIALDPRGVGTSELVRCDPDMYNQRITTRPTDKQSYAELVAHNKALGESCNRLTGPLINFVDTASVARDFDFVRAALGDEKLNYLGFSYGTQIGAQYAELFPDKVGRFALDGMLDHSQGLVSSVYTESQGYEATLQQFFKWCRSSEICALRSRGDPAEIFDRIVRSAEQKPIPAPGCSLNRTIPCRTDVTAEEFLYNTQPQLISEGKTAFGDGWAAFSQNLAEAAQGNATAFASTLATSPDDGSYSGSAIIRLDWEHANSFTDLFQLITTAGSLAPHTRGFCEFASFAAQEGRPGRVTNPPHELYTRIKGAPPILLVNAIYDPETSSIEAQNVRRQMPSSSLVLRNGSGHTSYFNKGETSRAIDRWLVEGFLPADGTIYSS